MDTRTRFDILIEWTAKIGLVVVVLYGVFLLGIALALLHARP